MSANGRASIAWSAASAAATSQRCDVAAALAALQAIDARPFADIVAVGTTAIEKVLLDARHERRLHTVLFSIRVGGRKAHIKSCLREEPLLDANDHRQVEHRVVRRNFYRRSSLFGLHRRSLAFASERQVFRLK